ncbi:MAG: outer-membrane lipoprotein carrier protein LolA [Bacteroidaceae bacterium]|nr:outer-membrane lipoprotein carrier protein LolA [Bacteroidaceae bacterium]
MNKSFIAFLSIIICTFVQSSAQTTTVDGYLDKVIENIIKSKGITAEFTMQGSTNSGLYMQGTMKMQGKKFYLSTNDLTTWYDGKTLWSYAPSIGEVNITTPTRQELAEINPYLLLDNYKQSFTAQELQSKHKGERVFRLTPTKRNTPYAHITVCVATESMSPITFEITDNNNQTTLIAITNYNNKATLSAQTFAFDASQYPNVAIIDLR